MVQVVAHLGKLLLEVCYGIAVVVNFLHGFADNLGICSSLTANVWAAYHDCSQHGISDAEKWRLK